MKKQNAILWISLAGIIGVLFGVLYAFFGLHALPVYEQFVPNDVYTQ